MSYHRSKAPLALMEQIIMIFVFALAAAVCLQAFVYSDTLSKKGEQRDLAVTRAQKLAEYCKAEQGNLDEVSRIFPATRKEDGLSVRYPEEKMRMYLRVIQSDEYYEKAIISVEDEKGEEIFSIQTAWQKGGAS